ncbi:hypothetical protein KR093_006526 [Drosophila rubida]|uniref:Uncharacterized protein n=1 Tax=Drosophila rubida TaxID=30044 RepID=A0AAD4K1G9_9MUSC|nr:hypothetical protein KR093_006526 [Drosophila rubida]
MAHQPTDLDLEISTIVLICLFVVVLIAILTVIIRSALEKRRQRSKIYSLENSPVVVTSATHTAPGGYPVTTLPASNYQTTAYAAPYPAQTTGANITVQMPMPMPAAQPPMSMPMPGVQQPQGAPYPPVQQYPGGGAANMNPPSYDMAMANPGPTVPPSGYEKQMPYNPNY